MGNTEPNGGNRLIDSVRHAHVAIAREQLGWSKDFAGGMFHVHCHKCGAGQPYLPPEFFGLLETADSLARIVLDLHGERDE